jgi:cell division protein FtsA
VQASGVEATQFVLAPLAAGEIALSETERQMGVAICDIGGGTTDLAIYIEGDVWHTAVLSLGGDHITSDIAHGLRLATEDAEKVKHQHGHASESDVPHEEFFNVVPFGEDAANRVRRADLAHIIGSRVEEIFGLIHKEIKRSGYDGLLPAGVVLAGGSSLLPGMKTVGNQVLGIPVRVAKPQNLVGLVDQLDSPAYAASIGLLKWAVLMNEIATFSGSRRAISGSLFNFGKFKDILRRLLP